MTGTATQGLRILVVDDEVSYCKMLGLTLQRLGHFPTLAFDPLDALEAFITGQFDAVITDIDMPGMNGVDLAIEIRRQVAEMPIAFCTGSGPDDECRQAAAKIGAVWAKIWRSDDVTSLLTRLRSKS